MQSVLVAVDVRLGNCKTFDAVLRDADDLYWSFLHVPVEWVPSYCTVTLLGAVYCNPRRNLCTTPEVDMLASLAPLGR